MSEKRSKTWCFTWNNYEEVDWDGITLVDCEYVVCGREVAPETGMKHLQGYIVMHSLKSLKQMKMLYNDTVHWEQAKGNASQNYNYCTKEHDFVEHGTRPADPGRKKGDEKWERAYELARAGLPQEDPHLKYKGRDLNKKHRMDFLLEQKLERLPHGTRMLWYWGKRGTGKSLAAHDEFPDAYLKTCNKWWCGYEMQDVVIIEEFELEHKILVHYLKKWLDIYPFQAEVKGSMIKIRPKLIVVTSNYHPSEIWQDLKGHYYPLMRRLRVIEFRKNGERNVEEYVPSDDEED